VYKHYCLDERPASTLSQALSCCLTLRLSSLSTHANAGDSQKLLGNLLICKSPTSVRCEFHLIRIYKYADRRRGARLHFTETPADSLQCGVISSRELLSTVLGLPDRQGVNRLYFEAVVLLR
jgi:hypothetical protein